jgi:hypothetical protein
VDDGVVSAGSLWPDVSITEPHVELFGSWELYSLMRAVCPGLGLGFRVLGRWALRWGVEELRQGFVFQNVVLVTSAFGSSCQVHSYWNKS